MPTNPYDTEYNNTAMMITNHSGDLDDLVLDAEDFDDSEEDILAHSDNRYPSLNYDEIPDDSVEPSEPAALNFDEADEGLNEAGIEDSFDNRVDRMLDVAAARINPARINAIVSGTDEFNVPPMEESVKSLAQYVKVIQESFDKYIAKKIENYSK